PPGTLIKQRGAQRGGADVEGQDERGRRLHQPRYSRGSVMWPVRALAATVYGDARKTCDSRWPMRPGKLRLVALMHFIGLFMRPNVSAGPPRQAAQPGFSVICTPASSRTC